MKRALTIKTARFDAARFFWISATALVALAAFAPVLAIIWLAFVPGDIAVQSDDQWAHLARYVLPQLVGNTLFLMAGVAAGTLILGAGTAWLIASFQFAFRNVLAWLLILPLALPAYISAYVYADILSYGGWLQENLRALFGPLYFFPEIRSLGGAIMVMSLAFYPYVYIAAHGVFARRSASAMRAARVLGAGEWACFLKIAVPLARPALAASVMLALMECLNDIGVVEHFGVRTLTMGLYDIWLSRNDLASAIQIALIMLVFAFGLIALERFSRHQQRYDLAPSQYDLAVRLSGMKNFFIFMACALPPLLGFFLPMGVLAWMVWSQTSIENIFQPLLSLAGYARQSLALAISAAVIITAGGLLLSYALRIVRSPLLRHLSAWASMGYALPGVVLGLGVLMIFVGLGNMIAPLAAYFDFNAPYVFVTGYKILLFAYFVRFLALPYGIIGAGLMRITPVMDMAARVLGARFSELFARIHLPLLRPAIWGGMVLVFVEAMRELPITLILRPFDFETLATHIYTIASLGLLEESALAALMLGLLGLAPAFLWARAIGGVQRRSAFL